MVHGFSNFSVSDAADTDWDSDLIEFSVKGQAYRQAAASAVNCPTTEGSGSSAFTALAASEGCYFLFCATTTATTASVEVYQSDIYGLDPDDTGADPDFVKDNLLPQFPAYDEDRVPFGYVLVKNGTTGSAWTFGTSLWNATGVAFAAVSISTLPHRPIDQTAAT
jgi:hypothetical protein